LGRLGEIVNHRHFFVFGSKSLAAAADPHIVPIRAQLPINVEGDMSKDVIPH